MRPHGGSLACSPRRHRVIFVAVLLAVALATPETRGQTNPGDAQSPSQTSRNAPGSSKQQTLVPAPRPNGQADTPNGSAKNGIIRPPPIGGATSVIPPPSRGAMPVIPPPGTLRNQPNVQPK